MDWVELLAFVAKEIIKKKLLNGCRPAKNARVTPAIAVRKGMRTTVRMISPVFILKKASH